MAPPFPNKYKKSLVKTEKDCWTCRKTTFTCLLTDNYASGGDFLYTCEAHLKDRNFAVPVEIPVEKEIPTPPEIPQADIDAAVKEYQERKKAKEGEAKEETPAKSEKKGKADSDNTLTASAAASPSTPVQPAFYELNKHFYEMRLRTHLQKKQNKEAQSRRAQLEFPSAPTARPAQSKSGA